MFEKSRGFKVFITIFAIVIGIFIFFPLFWMINTALKSPSKTYTVDLFFSSFTIDNFKNVLFDRQILTYLRNSLFVSFTSSFLSTIVSMFAGFSFSKFRYRGRASLMSLIMMAQAFPQAILLLTLYTMMQKLRLDGSYISLMLSYIAFVLPVGTWTLKAYFDQLPDSLIESAKVDGAGWFRIIFQIMFPLAVPGVISTAIYSFVWSWNDLLYSLTLITEDAKRTLAPGLVMKYMGEFNNNWAEMMAASIVVSIPVTIIFILLQKYFISGLTAGAVKE
ncbi:carbohydrate ABC transporter permease [Lapidilactobacillus achengensis]|uniref:Carbohydrate ABC transporter permease n=1 Tax=Lapidilactobacillus achengensis TaxID=2486000 RepID=A0ABW1UQR1_9LACO|nr:carbohydrate ABC transporter permease [Lapidilactobacillus achengensis]